MTILNHKILITERPPNVSVSVYAGLSLEELSVDSSGLSVTLREGQTFGLVCETESHFTADWLTVNDDASE